MKKIAAAAVVLVVLGCIAFLVVQDNGTEAASTETTNTAAPTSETASPAVPANPVPAVSESVAQAAMKKAADTKKYLYLFISENDNEETLAAKRVVEAAATKVGDKAELAFIKRDSAAEKDIVEKFQLKGAPMPIVLALAPNGAITGAYFAEKLKDPQLQDSIASESEQQCMKALQDGKLVFLCAQNGTTKSNDVAMQGVNDFKADTRFAQFTEVVKIDPSSAAEQSFLTKLKIDPKAVEATTAFLAPPGTLVAKVNGATSKDALFSSLMAASSGGCGGGTCGPKGCPPAK